MSETGDDVRVDVVVYPSGEVRAVHAGTGADCYSGPSSPSSWRTRR